MSRKTVSAAANNNTVAMIGGSPLQVIGVVKTLIRLSPDPEEFLGKVKALTEDSMEAAASIVREFRASPRGKSYRADRDGFCEVIDGRAWIGIDRAVGWAIALGPRADFTAAMTTVTRKLPGEDAMLPEEASRRKADVILRHLRVPEPERIWLGFQPPTKTVNVPVGRVPMGTLPTAPMPVAQTISVAPAAPPEFDRDTLCELLEKHLSDRDAFLVLKANPTDLRSLITALATLEDKAAGFRILAAVG